MLRNCLAISTTLLLTHCIDTDSDPARVAATHGPLALPAPNEGIPSPTFSRPATAVSLRCSGGTCDSTVQPTWTTVEPATSVAAFVAATPGSLRWTQMLEDDAGLIAKYAVIDEASRLATKHPDAWIRTRLWLYEPEHEPRPAERTSAARQAFVQSRRESCKPSQDAVAAVISSLGGLVEARHWLTNSLNVAIPTSTLEEVLDLPWVYGAYLPDTGHATAGGDGLDRELAFTSIPGLPILATANTGGSGPSGQIVVGVTEWDNPMNVTHKGFKLTETAGTRFLSTTDCGMFTCDGAAAVNYATHGTTVTSVLLGRIFGADFPAWNSGALARRGGAASEALIRYYNNTGGTDGMANAIEQAVEDGVDVINASWYAGPDCSNFCSNTYNPSNLRAEISAAENAGIAVVFAAGNCGTAAACTTLVPAVHPDVLTASGIADTIVLDGSGQPVGDDPDRSLASFSSRGNRATTNVLGESIAVPTVALAGYGVVRLSYTGGTSGFDTSIATGTSFAAPQIASLVALTRQWLHPYGGIFDTAAWASQINLLLMGDGRCGINCPSYVTVDSKFGYGVPRYFEPNGIFLGSTFGWGTRIDSVSMGETVQWPVGDSGPESTAITGWKWALAVDVPGTMTAYPKLTVRVVDTCAAGGTQVVRTALNQGLRYRIILVNPAADIHNRCLAMQVTGTGVAAGTEATFWSADMYFSAAQANHVYQYVP